MRGRLEARLAAAMIVVCSTSAAVALGLTPLAAATRGSPTACPSPPSNFTAVTATPEELSEYGLPQRPPGSTSGAVAAWATALDHAKHRVCVRTANSGGTWSSMLGSAKHVHPSSMARSERTEGADAAALAAGHWVLLPSAPITPRAGAAAHWTGKQMFVWGGTSPTKTYANGAVLDRRRGSGTCFPVPRSGRARSAPPRSRAPRSSSGAESSRAAPRRPSTATARCTTSARERGRSFRHHRSHLAGMRRRSGRVRRSSSSGVGRGRPTRTSRSREPPTTRRPTAGARFLPFQTLAEEWPQSTPDGRVTSWTSSS